MPLRSIRMRAAARTVGTKRRRYPFSRKAGTDYGSKLSAAVGPDYRIGTLARQRNVSYTVGRQMPLFVRPASAGTEAHFNDLRLTDASWNATYLITTVVSPALGDSLTSRDTARIQLLTWEVHIFYRPTPAGLIPITAYNWVGTMWLVYDLAPRGAYPAFLDIFATAEALTLQRVDTRDRFQILWRYNRSSTGPTTPTPTYDPTATGCVSDLVQINRPCVYDGSGSGDIANITTGALYFISIGTGANDAPIYNINARCVFAP